MSPSRHSGTAWQLASGNKGDLQCDELRPLSPTPNRQSSTFNPLIQGSSSYSLRLIDFSFIHISVHHILINYHALNCKKTTIIAISSVYNGRSLYSHTFTPSFTLCNTKTTISNVQTLFKTHFCMGLSSTRMMNSLFPGIPCSTSAFRRRSR